MKSQKNPETHTEISSSLKSLSDGHFCFFYLVSVVTYLPEHEIIKFFQCFGEVTYCSVSKVSSHMLRLSRKTSKQQLVIFNLVYLCLCGN